ncbi:hypothetical protein F7725_002366, partial [Dissostichus mawsoni]
MEGKHWSIADTRPESLKPFTCWKLTELTPDQRPQVRPAADAVALMPNVNVPICKYWKKSYLKYDRQQKRRRRRPVDAQGSESRDRKSFCK